jgi:hypothetical protein
MNGVFWRVKKAYNSGGMITASGNSLVWSGEGWGEAWRGGVNIPAYCDIPGL